ncbi:MAG: 6-phosphofructokinase, partial [Spirochaetales bacterium]|nr:6-phosphofructokinase [Spirochaetales bacterium]
VVAEGARPINSVAQNDENNENQKKEEINFFPHQIPSSEGLATMIETEIGIESRVTTLGYLQRGGIPTPADRIIATRLGTKAGECIMNHQFGLMMAVRGKEIVPVPLEEIAGKKKYVTMDDSLIQTAQRLGVSLGI